MDSRQLGIALASILAFGTKMGHAEVRLPGATLAVHNPPQLLDCVSEGQLQASVLSQLSLGVVSSAQAASRYLDVTIVEEAGELVAELRMSGDASGMRRMQSARCPGLQDALAITLAMILDSDTEPPSVAPAAEQNQLPPSRHGPIPIPKARLQLSAVRIAGGTVTFRPKPVASIKPLGIRMREHEQIRAWLGGGLGTPGSWHLESGLGLSLRYWQFALGAFWEPTSRIAMSNGSVQVMTLGGLVAACWHSDSHWRTLLCLRGAAGGERVQGIGLGVAEPSILPILHLGPSIGIETGSRWVFGLDLIGQASPWRDIYVVENSAGNQQKAPPVTVWLVARVALTSLPSQD